MLKRIMAIAGIVLILAWIIATFIIAVLPIPGKSVIFGILIAGCVILPIMLWIILWAISGLTGKDNVASFRTKEMNETMNQAEQIKYNMENHSENENEEN